MPDMDAGEHELIVEIPYNSKVNIEAMFLLGEFSVKAVGRDQVLGAVSHKAASVISPVRAIRSTAEM